MSTYVDVSGGVPCERTFKNIFNALKPEILEKALQEVSVLLRETHYSSSGRIDVLFGETALVKQEVNVNIYL
jgi:hypothetical protein